MISEINQWYLKQTEPNRSCFMALRDLILSVNDDIELAWKYRLPFFVYKSKSLCYLWQDKKTGEPYIGFHKGKLMNHFALESGDRTQIKIMRINPNEDIDVKSLFEILDMSIQLYK